MNKDQAECDYNEVLDRQQEELLEQERKVIDCGVPEGSASLADLEILVEEAKRIRSEHWFEGWKRFFFEDSHPNVGFQGDTQSRKDAFRNRPIKRYGLKVVAKNDDELKTAQDTIDKLNKTCKGSLEYYIVQE